MLQRLKDVFRSFADRDVRYVVIGGIAAVMHGVMAPFAPAALADDTGRILCQPDRVGRLFGGRTWSAAAPLLRPGG